MPRSLIPDTGGDSRNASFLATMSDLVYFPEAEGAPKIKNELGLDAKLISVKNTQAYVGVNDDHLVVCFRGSENPATLDGLKDWLLTNAMNLLVIPDGELGQLFMEAGAGARYHQGFVQAICDIAPPLFAEVEARLREKDRLVWVAGHSLGGALAMMASWLFLKKTIAVHQIYTFGAPMVGNRDVANAFKREYGGQIFRYVNGADPIPLLPMVSLLANEFEHTEKFMPIANAPEKATIIDFVSGLVTASVKQALTGEEIAKVWTGVMSRIESHMMAGYRKGLNA